MTTFETMGLAPALLRALSTLGHDTPTPIQQQAIPLVLDGHDLMGAAQTGTGKTGAFALPLLQRLYGRTPTAPKSRGPRILVLTPTRELAAQVQDSFTAYAAGLPLRSATIFGGVGMQPQIDALRRGLDVLIATPGRLIDHLDSGHASLREVEVLVLDEADRMLDMGFLPSLKRLVAKLPSQRQTLMFSATFSPDIRELAQSFLKQPREVSVTPRNTIAETIAHIVHPVEVDKKRQLLTELMAADPRRQTLVFARTKHGADRLARSLDEAGFSAAAIHGNKSQNARTRALADFKAGRLTVLVATDIAARGLDIPQLPVVVNYELPMVAEDYVHRIGRTGRAGETGQAISLVSHDESGLLHDIQKLIRQDISLLPVAGFEPAQPLRIDSKGPRPIMGRQQQGPRHPRPGHSGGPRPAKPQGGGAAGPRKPQAARGTPRHATAARPGQPRRAGRG